MLKIGDFSKLSYVPVKTLRYYDELGLLKPVKVDPVNGYRYYAVEQLSTLNRILAYKDLGFSLEQITRLLADNLTVEQMRGMLRLRQVEILGKLEEERQRLERVAVRLRQIEQEDQVSPFDVIIKKSEAQKVAALRRTIAQPQEVGNMIQELFVYLGQNGITPLAPPCVIWHDMEYCENNLDTEVFTVVGQDFKGNGSIRPDERKGGETLACTIYKGPYEGFPQVYKDLMGWIESNGYSVAAGSREIYLSGPGPQPTDPANYITEIQFPVEKNK